MFDNAEEPVRLLAVDDNADSAELVARIAERSGYEARFSCQPGDVPSLIETWRPDVLALDLCMPDVDGIELFDALSASGFSGQIVFISGQDESLRKAAARLAEARGLQVAASMPKPFDMLAIRTLLVRLHRDSRRSSH